jgi:hypothetical protein
MTLQSLWQTVWMGLLGGGFLVGALVGSRELELR